MEISFLTDEHVPSVFITTLRSHGYAVHKAKELFGERTRDTELLQYCATEGHVLFTHDKKDFSGETGRSIPHAGIVLYTDANYLRDYPEDAVRTLERVLSHYPRDELADGLVWLDQWRAD